MKKLTIYLLAIIVPSILFAEVIDHGGFEEEPSGGGDKKPPRCQFDAPNSATSDFFLKWNCVDNDTLQDEIVSQLWIKRVNSNRYKPFGKFIGFPASSLVNARALGTQTLLDGLPASFRLQATDKAGNSTISPVLTVGGQNLSISMCDFMIVTEATESTTETTGLPAMSVEIDDASVSSIQLSSTSFSVSAPSSSTTAGICEIDSICSNSSNVGIGLSINLDSNTATGSVSITPGSVTAEISGTASISNAALTELSMSGMTTIDGTSATITLACVN